MPWLLFYAYHTDEHLQLAGAHDTTHKHSLNCEKIYPAQAQRVHEPLTMMPACLCNTTVSMKFSWTCRRAGQHPPNLQKIYPAQAKRAEPLTATLWRRHHRCTEAPLKNSAGWQTSSTGVILLAPTQVCLLMPLSMRTGSVLCLLPFTSVGE